MAAVIGSDTEQSARAWQGQGSRLRPGTKACSSPRRAVGRWSLALPWPGWGRGWQPLGVWRGPERGVGGGAPGRGSGP